MININENDIGLFYKNCADILNVEIQYKPFTPYIKYDRHTNQPSLIMTPATRWGGREPGNGRFPGFGLIRKWGDTYYLAFTKPYTIQKTFKEENEVYEFLKKLMET